MIIAGVDPSLVSTGVAVLSGAMQCPPLLRRFPTSPADGSLLHRFRWITAEVFAVVEHAELVVIEGLSFASKGNATRDLAGLWWMLVNALAVRERLYPHRTVAVVAPDTLKLWATGHGHSDKRAVREAMTRYWGITGRISYDEADALGLASMGAHYAGQLPWRPTSAQERAIRTPRWDVAA